MQAMETEVKIRLADRGAFERKLPALGFMRVTARTMERNTLYDTPDRRLRNSRQILRIRQYDSKWVVTHKSVPSGRTEEGPHKNRVETETLVEDGPVLGKSSRPSVSVPYLSMKSAYRMGRSQATACWTKRPGVYAELEGPADWIDATAQQLGIRPERVHHAQLRSHFRGWRDETRSEAENFTFDEIPEHFRKEGL